MGSEGEDDGCGEQKKQEKRGGEQLAGCMGNVSSALMDGYVKVNVNDDVIASNMKCMGFVGEL